MSSPVVSLSQQEVAALAEYFKSITAAGSFPPDSSSYSGNIPDLIAVVSRLQVDKGFASATSDPAGAASGLLEFPSGVNDLVSLSHTLIIGNNLISELLPILLRMTWYRDL
jgi:hypothetical protein